MQFRAGLKCLYRLLVALLLSFNLIFIAQCGSSNGPVYEDSDYDGIWDIGDPYPGDTDNDGLVNELDDDDDGDGVSDADDVFPLDPLEQFDTDNDGQGNNFDRDDDNDAYADEVDAFPLDPTEYFDTDSDGVGDRADMDDDGDGILDEYDLFPTDPTRAGDADADGVDTVADQDADGDGYSNAIEEGEGTNPYDSSSKPMDSDGDGLTDRQELSFGSDPDSVDTDHDGLDDLTEYILHTFPMSADSDADTVGDLEEVGPDSSHPRDLDMDGVIDALDFYLLFNFRTDAAGEIFDDRFGITTDNSGNIYVANFFGNSIEIFDRDGSALGEIREGLSRPNDISYANGFFVVADSGQDRIVKLNESGRIVAIYEHQPDGTPGGFMSPRGVDATWGGDIYVADTWNNRIQKYDGHIDSWTAAGGMGTGEGEFINPMDISAGPHGTVAVADSGNFRVELFDKDLRFIRVIDGISLGFPPFGFKPKSLSYGSDGKLYITDEMNSRVVIIDSEGNLIGTFGSAGSGMNEFENLTAIHVDSGGKVHVTDNTRVQVF